MSPHILVRLKFHRFAIRSNGNCRYKPCPSDVVPKSAGRAVSGTGGATPGTGALGPGTGGRQLAGNRTQRFTPFAPGNRFPVRMRLMARRRDDPNAGPCRKTSPDSAKLEGAPDWDRSAEIRPPVRHGSDALRVVGEEVHALQLASTMSS